MRIGLFCSMAGLALAMLVLSHCATLNEQDCQAADWQALGESDGVAGRKRSYIAFHERACASFAIPVDASAWRQGWRTGIDRFCTASNGLALGLRGAYYERSCPDAIKAPFETAYRLGYDVYSARTDYDNLRFEISEARFNLQRLAPEQRPQAEADILARENALFDARLDLDNARLRLKRYLEAQ